MRWLTGIALLGLLSTETLAQTLSLLPVRPAAPVAAAEFDLVVLNDSSDPLLHQADDELPETLQPREGTAVPGRLVRSGAAEARIAPGAFARFRYRLDSPSLERGAVLVILDQGPVARIELTPAAAEARSAQQAVIDALQADPDFQTELGLVEFLADRLKPHEPIYFLWGDEDPAAKFQLSLKYQVFDSSGVVARNLPWADNLYITYSQTSFWDLSGESKPFFDNSYRPGVMLAFEDLVKDVDGFRFDLRTGFQHESNGRGGSESRSLNTVYAQPVVTLGDRRGFFASFGPRFLVYVGDTSDNPDIEEYRGYGDLQLIVGQGGGLQLAAIGRIGDDWDQGSLQLDLSFPIRKLTGNSFDLYLHTQYFTGFGESLLQYDQDDTTLRFGVSLVR